jgi:hypothetical protein
MTRRGFARDWHYLALRITNDAAFVVGTAYLVQSKDCKLGILCFRGTEPSNVINWLTDLTVSPESFLQGKVHGGIFRNLQAMWPLVDKALALLRWGYPITVDTINRAAHGLNGKPDLPPLDNLRQLYICGHSLGAAMAALAAANILTNAIYRPLVPSFRGAYTYGSPMIATPDLADYLDATIGHLVYRHVYAQDLVPRLPPLTTGRFKHFGREYRSEAPADSWTYTPQSVNQSSSAVSLAVGALAFVADQLPVLKNLDHHSPRYYMSASDASVTSRLDGLQAEWSTMATTGAWSQLAKSVTT